MNKHQFNHYLLTLEQTLLRYQHGDTTIIKDLVKTLNTRDIEQGLLAIGQATTLLGYHKRLHALEQQEFFAILPDFYQMDLPKPLSDYFEFGAPYTMRFKCSPTLIPKTVYEAFRQAQILHLGTLNLDNYFDLYELDINSTFDNSWYPIPIQMFAKFHNQSVDRVFLSDDGYFNLAVHAGQYVLPGGGMVEKDLPDDEYHKIKKVLEEYVEEERSDFYLIATNYIANIPPKDFKHALLIVLQERRFSGLDTIKFNDGKSLLYHLSLMVQVFEAGSDCLLKNMIEKIDSFEHDKLDHHTFYLLHQLRSHIQVLAFSLTELYAQAIAHIQKHALLIKIPMFLDVRVMGGHQISNTFIFKDMSLEQWFHKKLKCSLSAFGDDMTGASGIKLNFLEVAGQYQKVRGSHLLIMLANLLLVDFEKQSQNLTQASFQSVLKLISDDLQGLLV